MLHIIKKLSGHSGCGVYLCSDNDRIFVRKNAGTASYNARLKKQFIKQKKFHIPSIHTPKIYRHGILDGIFYFDMEYIHASTLAKQIHKMLSAEIESLIELLFNSLQTKNNTIHPYADSIFQNKIVELTKSCETPTPLIKECLHTLKKNDFSTVPHTPCCGDLTLENILISPSRTVYLIDLLDSFYDSWMIDVAKILQDLELGWSFRHLPDSFNLNLRLDTAKSSLLERLQRLPNGLSIVRQCYMILLLNTLRIIPYTSDITTKKFIEISLEKILHLVKKMD